jgi:hypothetical protein
MIERSIAGLCQRPDATDDYAVSFVALRRGLRRVRFIPSGRCLSDDSFVNLPAGAESAGPVAPVKAIQRRRASRRSKSHDRATA